MTRLNSRVAVPCKDRFGDALLVNPRVDRSVGSNLLVCPRCAGRGDVLAPAYCLEERLGEDEEDGEDVGSREDFDGSDLVLVTCWRCRGSGWIYGGRHGREE